MKIMNTIHSAIRVLREYFWIFVLFVLLVIGAAVIPFILMAINGVKVNQAFLSSESNPTMVNGILTVAAILFAFVTLELRRMLQSNYLTILFSVPLIAFLTMTLTTYFLDAAKYGYPTKNSLIWAAVTSVLCVIYFFFIFAFVFTEERKKREVPPKT